MARPLLPVGPPPGCRLVCGIDEAGRGPLAGPVVAAAVILPEGFSHPGIRDSKKLKRRQIDMLAAEIRTVAVAVGIGFRDNRFIDDHDILTATFRAMEDAVLALGVTPDLLMIDGSLTNPYLEGFVQEAVIGGDGSVLPIAAASIVAKSCRDGMMDEYARLYPAYGFETHKGYGTAAHLACLRVHGPSPIHRVSFRKVRPDVQERLL